MQIYLRFDSPCRQWQHAHSHGAMRDNVQYSLMQLEELPLGVVPLTWYQKMRLGTEHHTHSVAELLMSYTLL